MKKEAGRAFILFGMLILGFMVFGISGAGAENIYEKNYTLSSSDFGKTGSDFVVRELKYEPYPVNAGEWFDFYVKVQNIGQDDAPDVRFKLVPEYPFSSDDNLTRDYGILYGTANAYKFDKSYSASETVLKFRVMAESNAPEGSSNLKLEIIPDKKTDFSRAYDLPVVVRQKNTQIQESSAAVDNTQRWTYGLIGFVTGIFITVIILLLAQRGRSRKAH